MSQMKFMAMRLMFVYFWLNHRLNVTSKFQSQWTA